MKFSDFKNLDINSINCPICERKLKTLYSSKYYCYEHDCAIIFWITSNLIREVELRFSSTSFSSITAELFLNKTYIVMGSKYLDLNYLLDLEIKNYSIEEIYTLLAYI